MAKVGILAASICVSVVLCSLLRRVRCGNEGLLPDCNVRPTLSLTEDGLLPKTLHVKKGFHELLLISTLDGHISALDPNDGGKIIWSHSTGSDSMLSSSITRLEMSNNGQSVRLIPSLDGNLYKFNGKTVEPIPMSADTLLKSSFKLGDDVIITGGKDSVSFGISLHTGELRYSCSMQGCHTWGNTISEHEDILVIRRFTQTVRAVTPRSGEERWNFSVGEHHATFLAKIEEDCTGGAKNNGYSNIENEYTEDHQNDGKQVKVIVPDGMIALVDSSKHNIYWSRKFETPIVHVWHLKNNKLGSINLFDQKRVMGLKNLVKNRESPLLYIGRHNQQLYIQNSGELQSKLRGALNPYIQTSEVFLPTIEWKPYLASGQSRTAYVNHGKERPSMIEHTKANVDDSSSALVLKQDDFLDYPYDSGYYLYGSTNLRSTIENNTSCEKEEENDESEIFDIMRPILSLWHWWKEVCGISLATSILVHVLYTRRAVKKIKKKLIEEKSSTESQINSVSGSSLSVHTPEDNESFVKPSTLIHSSNTETLVANYPCEFQSRYTTDFEPIQRLGKGGFGVVFEARNKIDDCHYAVKRILLPDRLDAQEKVMREVKALAKLDHSGIVRYFNAWQETPPPGWQEQQDLQWEESSQMMSTVNSRSISLTSSAPPMSLSPVLIKRHSFKLKDNPFKICEGLNSDKSSLTKSLNAEDESGSFSFERSNINDSFEIIFQNNLDKPSTLMKELNYDCKML